MESNSSNENTPTLLSEINHFIGQYWLQVFLLNSTKVVITALNVSSFQVPETKLEQTIDFDKECRPIACFQKPKEFLEFIRHSNNLVFSSQTKTLRLKWVVSGNQYQRKIKYLLELKELPLERYDQLKFENYLLKKRINNYQGKQGNIIVTKTPEVTRTLPLSLVKFETPKQLNKSMAQFQVKIERNESQVNSEHSMKEQSPVKIKQEQSLRGRSEQQSSPNKPKRTKEIRKAPKTKKPAKGQCQNTGNNQMKYFGKYMLKYKKTLLGDDKPTEKSKGKRSRRKKPSNVRLEFQNGDIYEGAAIDDIYHGFGIYSSHLGSYYEGNWIDGKAEGQGTSMDTLGNKYTGNFYHDLRHGHGEEKYNNGEKYDGNFKADVKSGHGKYYYLNGDIFEGEWKENQCWGKGRQTYSDGSVFEGTWFKDEKDGPGELTKPNGEKVQVFYKMGELINEQHKSETNKAV